MTKFLRLTKWAALPLVLLLPLGAQNKKDAGITREQADEIL
jgi:hypothetical protein